ncbi:MAG: class I SAM-dependent methyltransferase, partial [Methylococcales bacterium]
MMKTPIGKTAFPDIHRSVRPRAKVPSLPVLARELVLKRLESLRYGRLLIVEGHTTHGFGNAQADLSATIHVQDIRFYAEIAFGGSIGAGEAYMLGYWSCNELTALVRIMVLNQSVLDRLEGGFAWLAKPFLKLFHWLNRNTEGGSRKNIAAHYDLGNELFELFLDPTLMYSSAVFAEADMTLEQASLYKLRRVCEKLQLTEHDHVLEIGGGWGGFAIYAAKNYGSKITTTTISKAQYELAVSRIRQAGLGDRIEVLLCDYRQLRARFDKLVSIEMIEAVGHQFYDTFFAKCAALLKPAAMMLVQAITIVDQRYETAKKSVDFIQRHIFPGSTIPSITVLLQSVTRASDLRLFDLEDIGAHYARTLCEWRRNFFRHVERIKALGYPDEFIRSWEFYFCYC